MSNFYQEIDKDQSPCLPMPSLEILNHLGNREKRLRDQENFDHQIQTPNNFTPGNDQRASDISPATLMKSAKTLLLQFNSESPDVISSVLGYVQAQHRLGYGVSNDTVLAILLQAAAEKVDNQQYVYARKLLNMCRGFACKEGSSSTQRLGYYFVEALQEKTSRETGMILQSQELMELEEQRKMPMDEKLALISLQPEILAGQQENPFTLVCQFMCVGSIRDSLASAKKVHIIDFSIDNGSQWTLIMQDFAVRRGGPLEILKITAVGTSKRLMEETGKRLSSFAEAMCLRFSFNIVVSDLKDLRKDSFKLEPDDMVAVYVGTRFWTLLAWPNYLESLIETIKSLKPCVMVVKEMDGSTNKNSFLKRFDESLILLSGIFDMAKDCLENHPMYRKLCEEFCCGNIIGNIVNAEGVQRIHRHERIPFWRSLFAKFDIVETELSRPSLNRSKILLKRSDRFSSFTLDKDGKCLILGWKGTPFLSVSAWKFPKTR